MATKNIFGIWNNKGGVGKSTITYHLSTRYAELHPEEMVLVVDMCPQANVSMMLLGGGANGETNVINRCVTMPTPQTIVGYLTDVITNGSGANLPAPNNYLTKVSDVNANLPENIMLLCGDGNLEPIAPAIASRAAAQPLTSNNYPWVWIHTILKNFIENYSNRLGDQNLTVFIDTNPSLGVYTEIALVASDKLLCPINADDSSRTAANAMAILLHGTQPPHPVYGSFTFAANAQKYRVPIPKIHLIIGNRLTQYSGAATAFRALSDASIDTLYSIYSNHPHYFSGRNVNASILSRDNFRDLYSILLRDFNSAGVVTAHVGKLLSHMTESKYVVYNSEVPLDKARISQCLQAVDNILSML